MLARLLARLRRRTEPVPPGEPLPDLTQDQYALIRAHDLARKQWAQWKRQGNGNERR